MDVPTIADGKPFRQRNNLKPYTFKNTEKTKEKGSDYETYSLLFLFAFHQENDSIDMILVDSFNDTTGCDMEVSRLWDVQSKGHKLPNPKKIGEFLFTLFDNFNSGYPFVDYILVLQEVETAYLVDPSKTLFSFDNFVSSTGKRVQKGLEAEFRRRNGLKDSDPIDLQLISQFLQVIHFKIWDKTKSESIKGMIPLQDGLVKDDSFYDRIFDEIRDRQTAIKNICIEGQTIDHPKDVLGFKKQIAKIEVVTLLVNRVIGAELFCQLNSPPHFVQFLPNSNPEDIKDLILECNEALSRTWFNKNNKKAIWRLIEITILMITRNPCLGVNDYLQKIPSAIKGSVHTLNDTHLRFFISRVLEGLK